MLGSLPLRLSLRSTRPTLGKTLDCCRGSTPLWALGLAGLALPKVCCVFWLVAASAPAIATSLRLTGIGATATQIDSLCRSGGWFLPEALNLPTVWAFSLLITGVTLLLVRMLGRTRA